MHCGTIRIRDLSSLPRYIDHDGDTSDGMSYAGTERWNWTIIDERFASGHVRATALSMNVQSRVGRVSAFLEHRDNCRTDEGQIERAFTSE